MPLDRNAAFAVAREAFAALALELRGRLDRDDFEDARYALPGMTLTQLEADAMNDRLQAFVQREVAPRVAGASAGVSFHDAVPDTQDEPDLDVEALWHDVVPYFRLDLDGLAAEDVRAWVAFLPRFHAVVAANGRPAGFRDVHAGAAE